MTKRLTIGLLINEIEGDYFEDLMKGVNLAAKSFDLNLVVIIGKPLNSPLPYEFSYNITYEFVNNKNLDGIIIAAGSMTKYITENQLHKFISRYNPTKENAVGIPTISISIPYGVWCGIDNSSGLKSIVSHLINEHKKERIAFLTGPDQHAEAIERFQAYRDTLAENDIPFDQELVLHGNFSYPSAYNAVKQFIQKNIKFDAIVSSNDEMALAVIKCLNDHGYKVPEDVAVTGFDNATSSVLARLTTIRQPVHDVGYRSVELLVNLINNTPYEDKLLGTEPVIRESCGCFSINRNKESHNVCLNHNTVNPDAFIEEFERLVSNDLKSMDLEIHDFRSFLLSFSKYAMDTQNYDDLIKQFKGIINSLSENSLFVFHTILRKLRSKILECNPQADYIEHIFFDLASLLIEYIHKKSANRNRLALESVNNIRHVLLRMLSAMNDPVQQIQQLSDKLNEMGIKSFYIYTYDNDVTYNKHNAERFRRPKTLRLFLSNNKLQNESKISFERIYYDIIPQDHRSTFLMFPLFFNDEQLGLILYEYDSNMLYDNSIFETLSVEISCALKISLLLSVRQKIENKLKDALKELEAYNEKLNYMSITDDLTGLHNRRGFIDLAQKTLELAQKMKNSGFLFFGDMDGLKYINDTFGHEEGNISIQAMADILRQAFRTNDIIARIGGDEFTIFCVTDNKFKEDIFLKRIKDLIEYYNNNSGKPYIISISIGFVSFSSEDSKVTIDMLMSEADNRMYEQKERGKSRG